MVQWRRRGDKLAAEGRWSLVSVASPSTSADTMDNWNVKGREGGREGEREEKGVNYVKEERREGGRGGRAKGGRKEWRVKEENLSPQFLHDCFLLQASRILWVSFQKPLQVTHGFSILAQSLNQESHVP